MPEQTAAALQTDGASQQTQQATTTAAGQQTAATTGQQAAGASTTAGAVTIEGQAGAATATTGAQASGQAAATWPENWRNIYAGEDAKKLARLERFTDPAKAFDALIEAQNKIRSGDFAKPLPADANEQERAAWRQANGIPEKPEGYFASMPDGLVIGKDDAPLFAEVGALAHKHNVAPAFVQEIAKWYYGLADKETAAVAEADKTHQRETTDVLRSKWGNDYRANIGQVMSLLDSLGGELKQQVMDATLPDGRRLFNSPEIIEWFAAKAREINPAGILIPAGGDNSMASLESEIQGIEKLMGNRSSEYWKGPKAEPMQARYRQLVDARQKLKARAA
jgi:hypothetical protein